MGHKRRLSLWSTGRKDHAPSGETKCKPEMAQSITDAISTGGNGGMWCNNGVFCNELINYAVRILIYLKLVYWQPFTNSTLESERSNLQAGSPCGLIRDLLSNT